MYAWLDTHLDSIAVAWFLVLVGGYRIIVGHKGLEHRSIVGAVQAHRVRWMRNMAERENRMLDALVLTTLSQGNAFFASTTAIAIGGLAALMGSSDRAQAVVERLPYVRVSSGMLWEIKLALMMAIFIYAFFKFAWAFRLSHYVAIMIASTPIAREDNAPECRVHADRTARLVGIAAEHANSGVRTFYYAIAALTWFLHPLLFMAASTWVLIILARRDFYSRSRDVLLGNWP